MTVHSGMLSLNTAGHGEIVDLTEGVRSVVSTSGVREGLVSVFASGSTVAVTTMEYEPGGVRDLGDLVDRLIPTAREDGTPYAHNALNLDTNAHAHLRAALIGPSEAIPVVQGAIVLGTWQQVVLIDFDVRARQRTVTVQVLS